jgi:hypothetical protein
MLLLQEFEKMLENMNLSEEKNEPLRPFPLRNIKHHLSGSGSKTDPDLQHSFPL